MHRICKKDLQCTILTHGFFFVAFQKSIKLGSLFIFGQNLKTIMVISNIFLVYTQHWEQHIEQISCMYKNLKFK